MLKAAARYGRPPSEWFGNTSGQWRSVDYVATLAFELYQDRLCSCGRDTMVCRHPFMDGWYEVETVVCHPEAAKARYMESRKDGLDPGELLYVVDTRPLDDQLPPIGDLHAPHPGEANGADREGHPGDAATE